MGEMAVNVSPERLPVNLEENETATPNETESNKLNNEGREDNLLTKETMKALELSTPESANHQKIREIMCAARL